MDTNLIVGIVGVTLTIVSLIYAIYVTRKSKQEKCLVYEVMSPVPVAEVVKSQSAYSLKVVYEKPNETPVYIKHAVAQYFRFTNFGRLPIDKNDLVEADPLRIEVTGGKVLDISLAGVTRDVCQISIGDIKANETTATANIDLVFLDHMDGGIIQILSDTANLQTILTGTIIGMPEGIKKVKDIPQNRTMNGWGCALGMIILLLSFGSVPIVYKFITGGWANVWLLSLPFAALIIPFLYIVIFFIVTEPRRKFIFPDELFPPRWYQMRRLSANRFPYRESSTEIEGDGEERVSKDSNR